MNSQILKRIVFAGLFAVPFVPFLFSGSFFFPFIVPKALAFRLIVEVILAAWVILALAEPAYRPKRSAILYSVLGFLAVIGLADILSVAPVKSFWSNFERMEGYVALLHLGAFFLVAGSVFKERDWKRWWNASLAASAAMALYAIFQVLGAPSQDGLRVEGSFGNPIYLAVYMLFHIFIALLFMWREKKSSALRWTYGLLIALELVVLYYTATRGAILGLIGGLLVVAVLSLFNRNPEERIARKAGIAVLVAVAVLVGGFFSLRNADFMAQSPVLSRFSSLTFDELRTQGRYFVWPIAYEGWKERPIFGWGQENFGYVFEKHYIPEMHRLEPWFDRAHNIFLDWMVAGGSLGLLSYLALYVALLYIVWRKDAGLSHAEKSVITGLAAAYFFHNFFVFDHLVSYILFFSLLSYVHYRGAADRSGNNAQKAREISRVALPVAAAVLVAVIYFVNIQPFLTNTRLLSALAALHAAEVPNTLLASEKFMSAYGPSFLGRQEVTEQIAGRSVPILTDENLSVEERNEFFGFSVNAVVGQADEYPDNARSQVIAGSFLSATGQLDAALVYLNRARELMPGKQLIYAEMANVLVAKGETEQAIEVLLYLREMSPDHAAQVDEYISRIRAGN